MNLKEKYPTTEGWLHLKCTIQPGTVVTEKQMCTIVGLGANAEVAYFYCGQNSATIVCRRKHSYFHSYTIVAVFRKKTQTSGWKVVGLFGEEDKGEGHRIGPFFEIPEAAEKMATELESLYGLPVPIDTVLQYFDKPLTSESHATNIQP